MSAATLLHVGNDMLEKAQEGAMRLAASGSPELLKEYYRLVSTGLACLEAAISTGKLSPRLEARTRLRYAAIMVEETENLSDAERMLSQGIAMADKHLCHDLAYSMHFVRMKVLFEKNPKASMIPLDKLIGECNTFRYFQWLYAFLFQKFAHLFQMGNMWDGRAMSETLTSITTLAGRRGDFAVYALASLMEGLAHLRQDKPDVAVRVQSCIAQASKYQLQLEKNPIVQLDALRLFLDLSCSLRQKKADEVVFKMKNLFTRMKQFYRDPSWNSAELLLPVRKEPNAVSTVSKDTSTVVRLGDMNHDYLVLSFLSKDLEAFAVASTLIGIGLVLNGHGSGPLQRVEMGDQTCTHAWAEAIEALTSIPTLTPPDRPQMTLQQAMRRLTWASELKAYLYALTALHAGTHSEWGKVQTCVAIIDDLQLDEETTDPSLQDLVWYLKGVSFQGRAKGAEALEIFSQERFSLQPKLRPAPSGGGIVAALSRPIPNTDPPSELAVLATLNRLWIMQAPEHKDESKAEELVELLGQVCPNHHNVEVRTAWNVVMASIVTDPPQPIASVKRHIQGGLNGSQASRNVHCLSVALNIMRYRLFENLVGEQALKSAKAASAQAKKVGNYLWMSVADGMLAQTYELQNQHEEYIHAMADAVKYANLAQEKCEEAPVPL